MAKILLGFSAVNQSADILILGAGAAGLSAARQLAGSRKQILVIEARPRAGGRVLTHRDPSFPFPVELGAEFIHGFPRSAWRVIEAASLVAVDIPDRHAQVRESRLPFLDRAAGKLRPVPDFWEKLGSVLGKARLHPRPASDRSFQEFLDQNRLFRPSLKRLAQSFVEGFDAADLDKISESSIAHGERISEKIQAERVFRLLNGMDQLTGKLEKDCQLPNVRFYFDTIAREIRWRRGLAEVATSTGTFSAEKLVIALPAAVLRELPILPELPEKRRALRFIETGPVMKLVMRFRSCFWEDTGVGGRDLVFAHSRKLPFPTVWTSQPLRTPVLTAWAGGPAAAKLAGLPEQKIVSTALRSLSEMFQMRREDFDHLLVDWSYHDWQSDPFARGAYSYIAKGGLLAPRALAAPVEGTLFFAGEATDEQGLGGTLDGAISSGERAADEVNRSWIAGLGAAVATTKRTRRIS